MNHCGVFSEKHLKNSLIKILLELLFFLNEALKWHYTISIQMLFYYKFLDLHFYFPQMLSSKILELLS